MSRRPPRTACRAFGSSLRAPAGARARLGTASARPPDDLREARSTLGDKRVSPLSQRRTVSGVTPALRANPPRSRSSRSGRTAARPPSRAGLSCHPVSSPIPAHRQSCRRNRLRTPRDEIDAEIGKAAGEDTPCAGLSAGCTLGLRHLQPGLWSPSRRILTDTRRDGVAKSRRLRRCFPGLDPPRSTARRVPREHARGVHRAPANERPCGWSATSCTRCPGVPAPLAIEPEGSVFQPVPGRAGGPATTCRDSSPIWARSGRRRPGNPGRSASPARSRARGGVRKIADALEKQLGRRRKGEPWRASSGSAASIHSPATHQLRRRLVDDLLSICTAMRGLSRASSLPLRRPRLPLFRLLVRRPRRLPVGADGAELLMEARFAHVVEAAVASGTSPLARSDG